MCIREVEGSIEMGGEHFPNRVISGVVCEWFITNDAGYNYVSRYAFAADTLEKASPNQKML